MQIDALRGCLVLLSCLSNDNEHKCRVEKEHLFFPKYTKVTKTKYLNILNDTYKNNIRLRHLVCLNILHLTNLDKESA